LKFPEGGGYFCANLLVEVPDGSRVPPGAENEQQA